MRTLERSLELDLSSSDLKVRWYGKTRLLIEEPPTRRLFGFWGEKVYDLPMPWLYYFVKFSGDGIHQRADEITDVGYWRITQLFGRPSRITDIEDHFCHLPLPNLYGSRPCYYITNWSRVGRPGRVGGEPQTHEQAIMGTLSDWWMSGSNFDAFSWKHHIFEHLTPLSAAMTRLNRAKFFFSNWQDLSIDECLAMPWQEMQSSVRSAAKVKAVLLDG